MTKTKILIADDHEVIRDGLKALLEKNKNLEVIAEASNGEEALDKAIEFKPDVAILDISMPVKNGMEVAKVLNQKHPEIRVIMLSMHNDAAYITQCLDYNVMGYLLKNEGGKELIKAVESVMDGKKFFGETVTKIIFDSYTQQRKSSSEKRSIVELTTREQEVINFIAKGYSNQKIADALFISFRTVETHRANLMKKLDSKNSIELVNKARESGLVN